jgi:hypothetical protein
MKLNWLFTFSLTQSEAQHTITLRYSHWRELSSKKSGDLGVQATFAEYVWMSVVQALSCSPSIGFPLCFLHISHSICNVTFSNRCGKSCKKAWWSCAQQEVSTEDIGTYYVSPHIDSPSSFQTTLADSMCILEFPAMFAVHREIAFEFSCRFVTPQNVVKTIYATIKLPCSLAKLNCVTTWPWSLSVKLAVSCDG